MIEKVITLEGISLVDFLGVENKNIKDLALAFPQSKIIARGNEIKLLGPSGEVNKIQEILASLMAHYHKYGKINEESFAPKVKSDESASSTGFEDDVVLFGNKGIVIKPKTLNQKKLIDSTLKNDLVFALGPAGTGKTYISVALAVRALKNKEVRKIIITRPAVEAGENLGFLPGDLKDKVDPYLRPIYDALEDMIAPDKLKYYYENRVIEIAPLAYMRGRTLNHAFILLDEAQNTTEMQMKMFLTRMGPQSKMIVTGDKSQVDLPGHQKSGLISAVGILKKVPGIGMVELSEKDVMRHKLVGKIIKAYSTKVDNNNSTTIKTKKTKE